MEVLHGKKRGFGRGLALVVFTLGLYALYWHYKVLREMYDQEKRSDYPTGLFVLAVIPFLNVIGQPLYMSRLLDTVNIERRKRGVQPIFGLGGFLAWYILGAFIIVGPFIAYSRLQSAINEYWDYQVMRNVTVMVPPAAPVAMPPY